jgi:hypothetical protein
MPAASAVADTINKPRLSQLESGRFMDAPSLGRPAHPAGAHGGTRNEVPARNVTKREFQVKKSAEEPFQMIADLHLGSRLSSSGTVTTRLWPPLLAGTRTLTPAPGSLAWVSSSAPGSWPSSATAPAGSPTRARKNYAGTAPITRASGSRKIVLAPLRPQPPPRRHPAAAGVLRAPRLTRHSRWHPARLPETQTTYDEHLAWDHHQQ